MALAPPEMRSALVCMARRAGATATAVAKMVASSAPERRVRCILCLGPGVEGHAAELQASDWVLVVKARCDFFGDLLRGVELGVRQGISAVEVKLGFFCWI